VAGVNQEANRLGVKDLAFESGLDAGIGATADLALPFVGEAVAPVGKYIFNEFGKPIGKYVVDVAGKYVFQPFEKYVGRPIVNVVTRAFESGAPRRAVEIASNLGNATARALSSPTGVALTSMWLGAS
jgi:hypothetical protein